MVWLSIRYRDFYDVPRLFVVERDGSLYLFDCSFDDILDEYPDIYRVYRLDPALSPTLDDGSWEGLANKGALICAIRTKHVRFDETLRAAVDDAVFERVKLKTIVERFQLDDTDRYYLWQSDLELAETDTVLFDSDGRVPTFSTEVEARAYGAARGVSFFEQTFIPFTNLDQLAGWCTDPRSETVDPDLFVGAWKLFADSGAAPARPLADPPEPDWQLSEIVDRLYFALSPTKPEEAKPVFTREELELLIGVLCPGLSAFRARVVNRS